MTLKTWEVVRTCYCHHVDLEVALEAQLVYPADIMPDQAGRILSQRCSQGMSCNLDSRPSCVWAGTNPAIDPFIENF